MLFRSTNSVELPSSQRRLEETGTNKTQTIDWDNLQYVLYRRIAYSPIFAAIGGDVQAGVFLSQAYYWTSRTNNAEGWFYKTKEEWFNETQLTRRQQDTVVKRLVELGLISIKHAGLPRRLFYKLNKEAIVSAISRYLGEATTLDTKQIPVELLPPTPQYLGANEFLSTEQKVEEITKEVTKEVKSENFIPVQPPVLVQENSPKKAPISIEIKSNGAEEVTKKFDNTNDDVWNCPQPNLIDEFLRWKGEQMFNDGVRGVDKINAKSRARGWCNRHQLEATDLFEAWCENSNGGEKPVNVPDFTEMDLAQHQMFWRDYQTALEEGRASLQVFLDRCPWMRHWIDWAKQNIVENGCLKFA
ncbi:hypothetical protein CAL7716_058360 [Calothrix sp. PCC 7716]|nr:hypothetical protein CAL7716_058360 [Calothrix sp. PCC 7716]